MNNLTTVTETALPSWGARAFLQKIKGVSVIGSCWGLFVKEQLWKVIPSDFLPRVDLQSLQHDKKLQGPLEGSYGASETSCRDAVIPI